MARTIQSKLVSTFAMLSLVLFGSVGCASKELWSGGVFDCWSEPARDPHLQLFQATNSNEILVVYDELREERDAICRRAYFLEQNQGRIGEERAPRFVGTNAAAGMTPIPIFADANAVSTSKRLYAVAPNSARFKLCQGTRTFGEFDLPVYRDRSGAAQRAVVFPAAAIADAAIAGGVVGAEILKNGNASSSTFSIPVK
jgi:hypothetical protein